jgi:glycerol-3-phosphate acyltransferase PlsY
VVKGEDLRRQGSGNVGGTNVLRHHGTGLGVAVITLDILKGFVPTLVANELAGPRVAVLTGAAAMLGHWRPVFLGFGRGGKMVATGGGVYFALNPLATAIGLALWIVSFLTIRYASIASILVAFSMPLLFALFGEPLFVVAFAFVAALLVVVLHRANLRRLRDGTESRFELPRIRAAFRRVRA